MNNKNFSLLKYSKKYVKKIKICLYSNTAWMLKKIRTSFCLPDSCLRNGQMTIVLPPTYWLYYWFIYTHVYIGESWITMFEMIFVWWWNIFWVLSNEIHTCILWNKLIVLKQRSMDKWRMFKWRCCAGMCGVLIMKPFLFAKIRLI